MGTQVIIPLTSSYRRILLFICVLILQSNVFADENLKTQKAITIGVITPMTGDFAQFGIGIANAMKLANKNIKGNELKLVFEDNRTCQAPDAITSFHKLISIDNAKVIATVCTAAAQAVLPLAQRYHIPLIQITDAGPDPQNYMLKIMPDIWKASTVLADEFSKRYKRMALVANEDVANTGERGNVDVFTNEYQTRGGQLVFKEVVQSDTTDFKSLIKRIQSRNAQAVIPLFSSAQLMSTFLRQADELHLWDHMDLAGNHAFEFLYSALLPLYPRLSTLEGLESANLVQQTNEKFINAYRAEYREEPTQFADYAYDVVEILKRCGVVLECYRESFEGISGPVKFDSNGQRIGELSLRRLKDGKFESVGPKWSTAN